MKKRIYLMIEILKREIDSRIYFAIKAAFKDFSIVIGNKSDIWARRDELQKGVVFFKSLGKTNLKLIKDLKKSGHKIAAWDEEAFVMPKKFNFFIKRRIFEKNLKYVDYFFTWGNREQKYLKSYYKKYKQIFYKTGNTRIDVLKKKNLPILFEEKNEILNKYGKFILFLTNFGFTNNSMHDEKKDFLYYLKLNGLIKEKTPDYNYAKGEVSFEKKNLNQLPKFIKSFSKSFPNKQLIIKPHPSEKNQIYFSMSKNYQNVKVVSDKIRSNLSWIMASEILISVNCTSSVEAYFMKKPSINFIQFNDKNHDFFLPKKLSINIYKVSYLIHFIKNYFKSNNYKKYLNNNHLNTKKINKNLKISFSNYSEETCSAENMLKILKKLKLKDVKLDKRDSSLYFFYFYARRKIREIYLSIKVNFYEKTYKDKIRYFRDKMINFEKRVIKDKVEMISKLNNYDSKKIFIKEIYPSIFLIEKK